MREGCRSGRRHDSAAAYTEDHCRCPEAVRLAAKRRKMNQVRRQQGLPALVPAVGTVRRLQALSRMGWSVRYVLATYCVSTSGRHLTGNRGPLRVRRELADDVKFAFEELAGRPGPEKKVALAAAAKGWASPLAWDDIDNPDEVPQGVLPAPKRTKSMEHTLAWRRKYEKERRDRDRAARALTSEPRPKRTLEQMQRDRDEHRARQRAAIEQRRRSA